MFFDRIADILDIPGLTFIRDHNFDDPNKMRNAGIRAEYVSNFENIPGLKEGVLLELGFDQTTPNMPRDITSWAFEKAKSLRKKVIAETMKYVNKFACRVRLNEILNFSYKLKKYEAPTKMILVIIFMLIY